MNDDFVVERSLSGAMSPAAIDRGGNPVYITNGGIHVEVGQPDMTVVFDDPGTVFLRQRQFTEIAESTFQLNGIKRYRALVGGGKCVLQGWGG